MTKILIVEDEFSIAFDLRDRLERMEYEVVDWAQNYQEALVKIVEHSPDIVLMDISFNDEKDGIDAAIQIHKKFNLPLIFVTALSDQASFQRAKEAMPMGYILKPFRDEDLRNNIELALQKSIIDKPNKNEPTSVADNKNNFVFLKVNNNLEKFYFDEVYYLEAFDNYTRIHKSDQKFIVNGFLKDIHIQFPQNSFVRIHRSYVVNIQKIKTIDENIIFLNNSISIPVSKSNKNELFQILNLK